MIYSEPSINQVHDNKVKHTVLEKQSHSPVYPFVYMYVSIQTARCDLLNHTTNYNMVYKTLIYILHMNSKHTYSGEKGDERREVTAFIFSCASFQRICATPEQGARFLTR